MYLGVNNYGNDAFGRSTLRGDYCGGDCGCNIAGSWDIDSGETSNPPSKPVGYNVADYNPHNNNPICECAGFPQHLGVLEGRNLPEALALYCPSGGQEPPM